LDLGFLAVASRSALLTPPFSKMPGLDLRIDFLLDLAFAGLDSAFLPFGGVFLEPCGARGREGAGRGARRGGEGVGDGEGEGDEREVRRRRRGSVPLTERRDLENVVSRI
jgi:hypothetical protein